MESFDDAFKAYIELENSSENNDDEILTKIVNDLISKENITQLLEYRFLLDKLSEFKDLHADTDNFVSAMRKKIIEHKVIFLSSQNEFKQRTDGWFRKRKEMFTASTDIVSLLSGPHSKSYQNTILKKSGLLKKTFFGNVYTEWGNKYEEIALQIYCNRYNKIVKESGLLQHPIISYLGGSPDGITLDGRILEIKVPKVRKIINGKISKQYLCQIQTQMEVSDLDVADFFECKIDEYKSLDQYYADIFGKNKISKFPNLPYDRLRSNGSEKGLSGTVHFYDNTKRYECPPSNLTTAKQLDWLHDRKQFWWKEGYRFSFTAWKLIRCNLQIFKRDFAWFNKTKEILKHAWKEVEVTKVRQRH